MTNAVLIRNAVVDGVRRDCRIADGRIAELAPELPHSPGDQDIDAAGGTVLPGLHDHHVHVLAAAAARMSLDLRGGPLPADPQAEGAGWLRVVGLGVEDVERADLDAVWPGRPVRAQHRSGALTILNTAAVDLVAADAELTEDERRTGRLWRERSRLAAIEQLALAPELERWGRELAAWGVTGLTDATPDLDDATLATIRDALPQRVASLGAAPTTLPRKVVVPDHADDAWTQVRAGVHAARAEGRPVALHAVSRIALALAIAALEESGAGPGDRIEHAAVCDDDAADRLAALGVVVVTQPSIAARRGRAMLDEVEPEDRPWLWRMRGLRDRGVDVVLSSDAPYGDADPWTSLRLATAGAPAEDSPWLDDQTLDVPTALGSYLTRPEEPAGPRRRIEVGASADLCLLAGSVEDALAAGRTSSPVVATVIGGRVVRTVSTRPANSAAGA